jgi:hypothetical protein
VLVILLIVIAIFTTITAVSATTGPTSLSTFPFRDSPIFGGTLVRNGRSKIPCKVLRGDPGQQSLNFIHAISSVNESSLSEGGKFNLMAVGIVGDGFVNTSTVMVKVSIGHGRKEAVSFSQNLFQQSKYVVGVVTGMVDPNKLNGNRDDTISSLIVRLSLPTRSFEDPITRKITNYTMGPHYVEVMVRDLVDPLERSCIRIEQAFTVPPIPVTTIGNTSFLFSEDYLYGRFEPIWNSPFQVFDLVTVDLSIATYDVNFTDLSDEFLFLSQNISFEAELVRVDSFDNLRSRINPEVNADDYCAIDSVRKILITLISRKQGRFLMPYCPVSGVWNLTIPFPDNIHVLQTSFYGVYSRQESPTYYTEIFLRHSVFGRDTIANQTASGLAFQFHAMSLSFQFYSVFNSLPVNDTKSVVLNAIDEVVRDSEIGQEIFEELNEANNPDEVTEILTIWFAELSYHFTLVYSSWNNPFSTVAYGVRQHEKEGNTNIDQPSKPEFPYHLHDINRFSASPISDEQMGKNPVVKKESIGNQVGKISPFSMQNQEITDFNECPLFSYQVFYELYQQLQTSLQALPLIRDSISFFKRLYLHSNSPPSSPERKIYRALLTRYFAEFALQNVNWRMMEYLNEFVLDRYFRSHCYVYCVPPYRAPPPPPRFAGYYRVNCGAPFDLDHTIREDIQLYSFYEGSCSADNYWRSS